jgi:hypothetical protein
MARFVTIGALPGRLVLLPLYAGDEEIGELVLGSKAERWPEVVRHLERVGLPKQSQLFGGLRYVPGIFQFFDLKEGVTRTGLSGEEAEDGPENWNLP